MRYGHVTNGVIDQGPCSLPKSWENISGLNNMSTEQLRQIGWLPWELIQVPVGPDQVLDGSTIVVEPDRIVETQVVRNMTPEEIAARDQQYRDNNKAQATSLLNATDWTCTVDINDPQYSNPYLGNQPAFLAYRSQVRQIAVNPPITVSEWPTPPEEVWVTV
jgi:hypothetical protein